MWPFQNSPQLIAAARENLAAVAGIYIGGVGLIVVVAGRYGEVRSDLKRCDEAIEGLVDDEIGIAVVFELRADPASRVRVSISPVVPLLK